MTRKRKRHSTLPIKLDPKMMATAGGLLAMGGLLGTFMQTQKGMGKKKAGPVMFDDEEDEGGPYWWTTTCSQCGRRTYGCTISPTVPSPESCDGCGATPDQLAITLANRQAFPCMKCKRLEWVPEDMVMDFTCKDCEGGEKYVAGRQARARKDEERVRWDI